MASGGGVLVTGGAGFIGSHLVRALLDAGHEVTVLDRLDPPGHRDDHPRRLDPRARFLRGDVGSPEDLLRALDGVRTVCHLAARGGFTPGIADYVSANSLATARLLELVRDRRLPVERLLVASSMAVYGEGAARCVEHGRVHPAPRPLARLERGEFEPTCPRCAGPVASLPTAEDDPLDPQRAYSITKLDQERLALTLAPELGLEAAALRYFVTYGEGQSLTNPYTGVLTLFAGRAARGLPPLVYEDGLQTRDFVHVEDVVGAHLHLLARDRLPTGVFNVGTGRPTRLVDLARAAARAVGSDVDPALPGRFRPGDVRHVHADASRLEALGWKARVPLDEGLRRFVAWLRTEPLPTDAFPEAERGLERAGLVRRAGAPA